MELFPQAGGPEFTPVCQQHGRVISTRSQGTDESMEAVHKGQPARTALSGA